MQKANSKIVILLVLLIACTINAVQAKQPQKVTVETSIIKSLSITQEHDYASYMSCKK